jgi:hypothetical protein
MRRALAMNACCRSSRSRFLGFDLDARVLKSYGDTHADDPAMIDLARWHQFESENTRIFAQMYQFAVQKA